jgi:hypothetical protein
MSFSYEIVESAHFVMANENIVSRLLLPCTSHKQVSDHPAAFCVSYLPDNVPLLFTRQQRICHLPPWHRTKNCASFSSYALVLLFDKLNVRQRHLEINKADVFL